MTRGSSTGSSRETLNRVARSPVNRRSLLKGGAAAGALALGGVGGGMTPRMARRAAAQGERGTINLLSAEPFFGSWDPSAHTILANIHAEWNVFDRLMAIDWETKELLPRLAESWEWVEPAVLELKLREGVVFHDGSPFTANDVKSTLEYVTGDDVVHRAWYRQQLEVEVVDDTTARVHTGTPYPGLLYVLPATCMLAVADVADPGRLEERYNGTGPYKWEDYSQETLTCVANDDYWDGAPGLAGYTYQYVADPGTRLAALQTGEADMIERVESEQIPEIEMNPDLALDTVLTTENKWLIFKAKTPHMDNQALRLAISYAIDRNLIVDSILEGHGRAADAHVAPIYFGYKPQENNPTYDPERAKELLAEAGFPNGEGLDTLTYVTSVGFYPKTREYGQYITQALTEIGLKIDFQAKEPAAWLELLYAEEGANLFDTGWMPPSIDPDLVLKAFFYDGGRITYFNDQEINDLIDAEGEAEDQETRLDIVSNQLLPALMEKMPALPLFTSELISGVSGRVSGFKVNANSTWDLKDVTVTS
jgi:peptide/nickel transport system substrate-binding protein